MFKLLDAQLTINLNMYMFLYSYKLFLTATPYIMLMKKYFEEKTSCSYFHCNKPKGVYFAYCLEFFFGENNGGRCTTCRHVDESSYFYALVLGKYFK